MNYKRYKQYRLKNFDYSGEADYFVTICTKNRRNYFGKIVNSKMVLSDIGRIAEKIWQDIPSKFANVKLDKHQFMPNHFHGIINIKPGRNLIYQIQKGNIINEVPTLKSGIKNNPMELQKISLGRIIRWFKGRVSFEAKKLNRDFSWQQRYCDRIIRNEKEYYFVIEYIENNPANYGSGLLTKYFEGSEK
jgi:REP element-mobilizing transposase RayT